MLTPGTFERIKSFLSVQKSYFFRLEVPKSGSEPLPEVDLLALKKCMGESGRGGGGGGGGVFMNYL
jgi:hypothetical protein